MTNITKQSNIVNKEFFEQALHDAVERQLALKRNEVTESEVNEWIFDNKGKLADELENSLAGVVSRVLKPKVAPTAPVISLNDGKIQLWAVDAHQPLKLAEHRSFNFGTSDTASLVYEERSAGHRADEVSLDDPSIWKWLQRFVDRAQQSEELVEVAEAAIAACSPCKGSGQYVAQLTGGAKETRTCPKCAKARAAVAKALALRNQI